MANDYAMSAKARSLYSQHLTMSQFETMMGMADVPSLASYLKQETRYSVVLDGINEKSIHRDLLEQCIRHKSQQEFLSLIRYMKDSKVHFYEFYTRFRETEQIMYCLHSIQAHVVHNVDLYIINLNKYLAFDVVDLSKATTYEDLLAVLENTDYYKVLAPLLEEPADLVACEQALKIHYNDSVHNLVKQEPNAKEVSAIFLIHDELTTLAQIYRMKRFFNASPREIRARVHSKPFYISEKTLNDWIDNKNGREMLDALRESPYGKYSDFEGNQHIEYYMDVIRHQIMVHMLRFSQNTNVVLYAYMYILKNEIDNIIQIIEGVRYQINADEIKKILII